ncbi:MAG TPA: vitamin B12 dependent-methionine synthase activation domain-containing protein [Prolixibacteraceae bacterium]|jgi:hypothetical protein
MQPELRNFAFSFDEMGINVGHVEEAMGYGGSQSPEPFPEMIAFALAQCEKLCDIQVSLLISNDFLVDKAGTIVLEGTKFNVGKKIAQQLKNADGGALFIGTAGAGIGEKSKKLMAEGDMIEGYILDVIGSVTIEAAIDKLQDSFEFESSLGGNKITNRYSPGYCGWALSEQKQFFELFPRNHCGITLSDSCLMDPVKSVSGVIGFGANVKKTAYECQMCELETCIYRKIRLAKAK